METINQNTKKFTISVEGNIGCGKSTVLSALSQSPFYNIILEPIEKWQNYHGYNILENYYKKQSEWAFRFEIAALTSLSEVHTQPTKSLIKLLERSIHCARYCFIENLHQKGILEHVEYHLLDDIFKKLTENEACKIDLIIYLRTKPETCLERIRTRNRPEESTITLDDLKNLHQQHEQWLINRMSSTSVIIVDADQNTDQVYLETQTHVTDLISKNTV